VLKLTDALNNCAVDYLMVGGVAAVYYGRPRTTSDCDIVLSMEEAQIKDFANCLKKHEFSIREYDVIEGFKDKSHFNAYYKDSPYRADFSWKNTSLDEHGFERAKKVKLFGTLVKMEAPEDIIIAKLVYGSPQDLEDAKAIFLAQKNMDKGYIEKRAQEEGVNEKLQALLNKNEI
jgi:site-specific DNA-adenine methylase